MKFRVITHTLDNNMKPIENSKKVYDIGEFKDIDEALKNYSPEWKTIIENYSKAKCEICGYCTETNSCGRYPKKKID